MASTSTSSHRPRVMFVCLGNICRSPTAEAVFKKKAEECGMDVEVASSGTGSWHVGSGAHPEMIAAARRCGYSMEAHRAQQVKREHMEHYDHILAMDTDNERTLRKRFPDKSDKVTRFCSYAPELGIKDTPDPYFMDNFDEVVHIVEAGCDGLLAKLRSSE